MEQRDGEVDSAAAKWKSGKDESMEKTRDQNKIYEKSGDERIMKEAEKTDETILNIPKSLGAKSRCE